MNQDQVSLSKEKIIKTQFGFKTTSKDKSTKYIGERYQRSLKVNSFALLQMTFTKSQVFCCLLLKYKLITRKDQKVKRVKETFC